MAVGLSNWSDNFVYSAESVHRPTSVAELQQVVAVNDRVKAVGTRHSFSTVADSPGGALVFLSQLEPGVVVDKHRMVATVTAGTPYGVLAAELERQGCALANMGSLPHISVGGGTATGTHGSGDGNGILATAISAVELVIADGSLIRIDRSNPDLAAIAVGLGAFGVVTRLELDVQPSYQMRQDVYAEAPWGTVLAAFDEVMASAYSVCLIANFGHPTVRQIWQKVRLDADPPDACESFHGGAWIDDSALPEGHSLNPRAGITGPWCDRLPHFRLDAPPSSGGSELQSEYFVPRVHAVEALEAMLAMGDRIEPHLRATEIRTAASDELWLSPAYQRDCLCIGFTWHKHPEEVDALLPDVEAALEPYEPRPHWGKLFAFDDVEARFARAADFVALAKRYDPSGKFWNPFLDQLYRG
ncbi:MAG: D-arabinono-1,4-lactone oxidase [Acidimicrobiales bacterium]